MAGFLKSILFPSENEKKRKEIRVGIAELAPIWLKYNQFFVSQKDKGAKGTEVQPASEQGKTRSDS